MVLVPSISSPPPTARVPEDFPELSASGDFFSFLLNRLPNERGGDTIHLYPNHNKTVTVIGHDFLYNSSAQIEKLSGRLEFEQRWKLFGLFNSIDRTPLPQYSMINFYYLRRPDCFKS